MSAEFETFTATAIAEATARPLDSSRDPFGPSPGVNDAHPESARMKLKPAVKRPGLTG
jgi:hypothetical protein